MGKNSALTIRLLAVAVLLWLGACTTTKADTITGGFTGGTCPANARCWSDITVTGSEPGYTSTTSVDTVEFFTTGGLGVALVCQTPGSGTCGTYTSGDPNPEGNNASYAQLYGSYLISSTASPVVVGSGGPVNFTNSSDIVCWGDLCNNGLDPTDTVCEDSNQDHLAPAACVTYMGTGYFDITSDSIDLTFTLPATAAPEPSSLLLLCESGLMGMVVFGWRRKGKT